MTAMSYVDRLKPHSLAAVPLKRKTTPKGGSSSVCYRLPFQPVDATHALKRSAGVSNSNVSRGRSFNSRATLFKVA